MQNNYFKKIKKKLFFIMLLFGLSFSFNNIVMAQIVGSPGLPGSFPAPKCGDSCLPTQTKCPDCLPGNVTIIKNTKGGDKDSAFNFTFKSEATKKSPSITKKLTVIANTPISTSSSGSEYTGQQTISLKPGKYEISELAREADDWNLTSAKCSSGGVPTGDGVDNVVVTSGSSITCTFNNNGEGKLKIVTNTVGENEISFSARNFEYTVKRFDPGSPSQTVNTVVVNTNREIRKDAIRGDEWSGENQITVDKGITVYTILQKIDRKGWALDSVQCEVQNKESSSPTGIRTQYAYGILNVTVRGNRTTTCTFKNTKKGEIEIVANYSTPPQSSQPPSLSAIDKFNYDINFVSTEYFPPNILPFAIASDQCGPINPPPSSPPTSPSGSPPLPPLDQECTIDQDCNICRENCGICSPPKPPPPGPGYSPTRMTINVNKQDKKRIYPGIHNIIEYLPERADNNRWSLSSVKCTLENGQPTGESNVKGVNKVNIFSGKKTICVFNHVLRTSVQGPGSGGIRGGGTSPEPPKPTTNPI